MQVYPMFTSVTVERLYSGSVFKLIGIGLTCSLLPVSFLAGLLTLFGPWTITWNEKPIAGMWGVALAPVLGVLLTLLLTFVLGTACAAGLWVYSKFRPLILWGKEFAYTPAQSESGFGSASRKTA
jgi:hypothetical protein